VVNDEPSRAARTATRTPNPECPRWAYSNGAVAVAQKIADEGQVDSLVQLVELVVEFASAGTLAVLGIIALVGLQGWCFQLSDVDLDRIFGE